MMPRQGTMVADRYCLERKVGGGRVSAMWRVQDQVTAGACAVKLLHRTMNDHPEALARFSLEDRLSRELTGAYFPERIGSGSWHSLRYIAWRWYEGECLRSLFERNPKQDVQTVYSIVQETCQALTIVHGAGYTHGDLKPENLFFSENGESAEKSEPRDLALRAQASEKEPSRQLKLLGFGVASRLARPLLGSQARRTPGQIVGTPLYLSPDLILGRVPRAGQADLWALSVIVYEALTGRAPFLGTDLTEVLESILERRAPRPSSVTDNLPGTVDLWWAQALEQQFATPGEFTTSLARALAPALRSSRTQRSASMPDRTAPVAEAFARRPTTKTPVVGQLLFGRSGAPASAGGTAAGLGRDVAHDVTPLVTTVAPRPSAEAEVRSAAAKSAAPSKEAPAAAASPPAPAAAVEPRATPGNVTSNSVTSNSVASNSVSANHVTSDSAPGNVASTGNVTSTTVAGIGPAALSVVRALEAAAAGTTAKIRVVAPSPGARADGTNAPEGEAADKFAPLPSPLRDLGLGARKTLVGIIPPSAPAAPAPASVASSAPSPSVTGAGDSMVIAGTPCKSIETSDVDEPLPSIASLRRLGSPTVPFPRPRATPRQAASDTLQDPGPEHHGTLPTGSWQQRTSNTLRIVLTDPDHRPHLVAGLVVCAAAALVIFVSGRSPVAGTGVLGQSTSSLSAEPGAAKSGPALEAPVPPAAVPRAAVPPAAVSPAPRQATGGADVVEPIEKSENELAQSSPVTDRPLPGRELAPGLVVPPSPAGAAPARSPEKPRVASPSPLPPSRPETQRPVPPAAVDGTGNAPHRDPALATPPRAVPRKPGDPVPPPPRPANADFDFGI